MLSYFFPEKNKTPFESTVELKDLIAIVTELRAQEKKLKNTAQDNPAEVDAYKKSKIFSAIMLKIEEAITEFNKVNAKPSTPESISAILVLATKIKKIISTYFDSHKDKLNKQLDGKKEAAKAAVAHTTFLAGIGAGVATGSVFVGLVATGLSGGVDSAVMSLTGLSDSRSTSVQLLEEAEKIVGAIQDSLEFVTLDLNNQKVADTLPLVCSITRERMTKPSFCMLDGRLYEREAILKWLNENRSSPFNRKKLQENQRPEDVLVDNISLREALEELEKQFKMTLNSEAALQAERVEMKV